MSDEDRDATPNIPDPLTEGSASGRGQSSSDREEPPPLPPDAEPEPTPVLKKIDDIPDPRVASENEDRPSQPSTETPDASESE